jgi:hypothetical protein
MSRKERASLDGSFLRGRESYLNDCIVTRFFVFGRFEIVKFLVLIIIVSLIAIGHVADHTVLGAYGAREKADGAVTAIIVDPVTFGQVGGGALKDFVEELDFAGVRKTDRDGGQTSVLTSVPITDIFESAIAGIALAVKIVSHFDDAEGR